MSMFCNEVSVRNRAWIEREPAAALPATASMRDGRPVPAQLCEVILRRGVTDLAAYLEPTLRAAMPDPYSLLGMEDGVKMLVSAILGRQKICVYGDYDVDGATSTALMTRFLRQVGIPDSIFYIPQRLTEGYGPNVGAMQKLKGEGVELLLIADSGTLAFEPVSEARRLGMDVIVIDHHEPMESGALPDAVVINPKKIGEDGSLSYLCTAGLTMMFLVAVNRRLRETGFFEDAGLPEPKLLDMMGIVALGTVCDVVPLKGLNRAFVKLGLSALTKNPGIRALLEVVTKQARKDAEARGKTAREIHLTAHTCGFLLGPCINAGGRLADTMQGSRLLTTDDPEEAAEIAATLFELNRERRELQKDMVEAAREQAGAAGAGDRVIVVYDENWHPGVVGIAASKIVEFFDRPAVIIGRGGKGSGRSLKGFSIGKAFIKAHELGLLIKGGGHDAAGGLTIDPGKIAEFRVFLNEQAAGFQPPPEKVDLVLPVGGLRMDTVAAAEAMAPFGMGNASPRFALTGGVLRNVKSLMDIYIKGRLVGERSQVDIYFRGVGTAMGDALLEAEGKYVDVMGTVSLNTFGGTTRIQIEPKDVRVGGPADAARSVAA